MTSPANSGVTIVSPRDVDGGATGAVTGGVTGAVAGAGLPETVVLREIPDYEYRYVYVNGQPVLVEPSSRRIVYVMR